MKRIESSNDFVVKFANVNGSGSASANTLFAKAILRMGVPVSPRNIFPSNIQGLPTWYEVRVSEQGCLGRRGGVDLMVAMNPQTWEKDVAEIEPGGYLFYDSTKPMPPAKFRADVNAIGVPLTAICNAAYSDARQRQLFKNIIYLGALSALLDIVPAEIERLFAEQYKGKEALLDSNRKALAMGRDYALENFACPLGLRVERRDKVGERIFIDGNSAAALGAVYGGATVAAWYPITPSSSLAEAFMQHGSPSTGMPTRTQQADLISCAYASHGDTKHVLLLPEDPCECFEFGALAFDLADRLHTPVFVMLDLDIGMQDWLCEPLAWDDSRSLDRGKVMTAADLDAGRDFGRYLDVDGDGIPYRTYPGTHAAKGSFFTRGTTKDRYARYTEEGPAYVDNMQRLLRKFETARSIVPKPVLARAAQPTSAGVIWFGSTGAAMAESLAELERQDVHLDRLRIRAFPFDDSIPDFVASHEHVFVVEQNRDAQLKMLLVNECGIDPAKLTSVLHYDGTPITERFITREIGEKARLYNVTPLTARRPGV